MYVLSVLLVSCNTLEDPNSGSLFRIRIRKAFNYGFGSETLHRDTVSENYRYLGIRGLQLHIILYRGHLLPCNTNNLIIILTLLQQQIFSLRTLFSKEKLQKIQKIFDNANKSKSDMIISHNSEIALFGAIPVPVLCQIKNLSS